MSPIFTFLFGAALLMILLVYVGTTELKRKRILGTLLTVLATVLALYTIKQIGIKKGIDLQGGSEFVVELQPSPDADGKVREVFSNDIQQAIGILEKRLNPDGAKDLVLAPQGDKRILILVGRKGDLNSKGEFVDPWGTPLQFFFSPDGVMIRSAGPNQVFEDSKSGSSDDVFRTN